MHLSLVYVCVCVYICIYLAICIYLWCMYVCVCVYICILYVYILLKAEGREHINKRRRRDPPQCQRKSVKEGLFSTPPLINVFSRRWRKSVKEGQKPTPWSDSSPSTHRYTPICTDIHRHVPICTDMYRYTPICTDKSV